MSSQQNGSKDALSKDKLLSDTVALIQGSHQPDGKKMIGVEVELPFVSTSSLMPIPFSGQQSITAIFNMLCKKGNWKPDSIENGHVTSLIGESGSITLEPGGQIEFSGAARSSLSQIRKDIETFVAQCQSLGPQLGVDVTPFGFHPHVGIEDCPYISERSRFKALKPVFEAERGYSAWGQSSSVQITLDAPGSADPFSAFKLGLALQPVAAALFANSPFAAGHASGYQSWRRHNLQALESPLYSVPEELFEKDYGLEDWAKHVLSVPMSFIVRRGAYIAVAPIAFEDAVGKPLPELAHLPLEMQYLTKGDLLDHLTGIKPEMLLKPNMLLEFRAADLGPSPAHWMALAAFWSGIFYDVTAFKAAEEYVAQWSKEDRMALRKNVAKDGLDTQAGALSMQKVALDLLKIAQDGLSRLEPEAVSLLDPLFAQAKAGETSADAALSLFAENEGDITATVRQSFLLSPHKRDKKAGIGL